MSSLVSLILLSLTFLLSSKSSTHALFMKKAIPLLILTTIVVFFSLLCMKIACLGCFFSWASKVGCLLGGRALSFLLIKLGCSGGLALALVLVYNAFLPHHIRRGHVYGSIGLRALVLFISFGCPFTKSPCSGGATCSGGDTCSRGTYVGSRVLPLLLFLRCAHPWRN